MVDRPAPREAPVASTQATRRRMEGQGSRDTRPELELRRLLHAAGLRYRVHRGVLPGARRKHDIVFGPARIVVEVRGCWWHGCEEHFQPPKAHSEWWTAKIARNRARDQETDMRLAEAGWHVEVVWEHEDMNEAAKRIIAAVARRRQR